MQENVEKKNTMNGPLSPLVPSFLTQAYAHPANIPPKNPMNAGRTKTDAKLGFTMNILPINADVIQVNWNTEIFSLRIR